MKRFATINDIEVCDAGNFIYIDPIKISLNITKSGVSPLDLKKVLMQEFGIYVSHTTRSSILFNIQVGITVKHIDDLIKALELCFTNLKIYSEPKRDQHYHVADDIPRLTPDQYLIPYPPGVPIQVPNEEVSVQTIERLSRCVQAETSLIHIDSNSI